ncbi:hypothetical protein ACFV2N_48000 [Streptomyces sp. NPDC059680]|uniref:hypothetical protein n=1 Tax=Streptomyces sp. NPDC059680 TaxID=3346904 RepID=UPI0036B2CE87
MDALHTISKVVADQTEQHGGRRGRSALAAYLADDVGRVLTADAPAHLCRELFSAAAQLTHLLAMMTDDAGHEGLAQMYYRAALDLARDAGNPAAYAVALRATSAQALRMGHYRHALDLADAAMAVGAGATGATKAFLLSQQAVARAHDGQRHASITSLVTAETCLERASSVPGPFTAYPRAGFEYQRAQTLLALGLRTEALTALRDSLRHRDSDRRRTSALTEFRLGEVLMAVGHLDEACVHWSRFLDHCPQLRSARIDQALAQVQRKLGRYQEQSQASEVRERARVLTRLVPSL